MTVASIRLSIALLWFVIASFAASPALAQATNYTSVETTSGTPIRLSYHASAHDNCTPAPPPTIKVSEPPKSGTLEVRKGTLATDRVPGCGRISVPVQVVFYNPKEGYVGSDHVVYEVTDSNGQVTTHDVTIAVKAGSPGSPAPAAPSGPAPNGRPGTKI
jgi:hypothetical protein